MPTKTERILNRLPGTFRVVPRAKTLYSVTDTFGNELLMAENSLAAIMLSHWVDHADRGAELINDLACFAALYGLAPRRATQTMTKETGCQPVAAEESVEEFRKHLKRYVRTFLEGTVTVQGILRITAEALGLEIVDDYKNIEAWWMRPDDSLTTGEPRGDDAAESLLGFESADVTGEPARPARTIGRNDLSGEVDLRGASDLRLGIDGAIVNIHLDPDAATLDDIEKAINEQAGKPVASNDGRFLTLNSPTVGPDSELEIQQIEGDAATRLLGLMPRSYNGSQARSAQVIGKVDLSGGVDLSKNHYLRLLVDQKHLAEVDCAGSNPADTKLDEIKEAINNGLGLPVATDDDNHLILTSPTKGFASKIALLPSSAQDAREALFGPVESFHVGDDARPAHAVGGNDLSKGVDLSAQSKISVRIDNGPPAIVDCAGVRPWDTRLIEIVDSINARLGPGVASHDGRFVHLVSPTTGPSSAVIFESLPEDEDATLIIFSIGPRTLRGAAATPARIVGSVEIDKSLDLEAVHSLQIGLDNHPPVEVDVRAGSRNPRKMSVNDIAQAINRAFGENIASQEEKRLTLTSPMTGPASRIVIKPLLVTRRRRFVTRAFMMDEAAQQVFGFVRKSATGEAPTRARVKGSVTLSQGVDLREARFLRLAVDDFESVDIDCAGLRPRATTLRDVVEAINNKLKAAHGNLDFDVASDDGKNLLLTSPTAGAGSRIAFESPRASDALGVLLGGEPRSFRGRAATGVSFIGLLDLSAGVDLSAASHIKLKVDDVTEKEISCAGFDPAHTSLAEMALKINLALDRNIAHSDGTHLILTSSKKGIESHIEFISPSEPDATKTIFGIAPPRSYQGAEAAHAQVTGETDLSGSMDLSQTRFLRVSVNGDPPLDIDCASGVSDAAHATLEDVVKAINSVVPDLASATANRRLRLASPTPGENNRLDLLAYAAGDAFVKLLGDVERVTEGIAPSPAVIEGNTALINPVDLSEQRSIRLSVDGARAKDLDISGDFPEATSLAEIINAINNVFPGLASASENNGLLLTSPSAGENSQLELLPLRALELIEYPQERVEFPLDNEPPRPVRHGDRWTVLNNGAAEADLRIEFRAPQGAVGPEFVNRTTGQRIRLNTVVRPGERAELWRAPDEGIRADIISVDNQRQPLHISQILAGPIGAQIRVPFQGERALRDGTDETPAMLQLNNSLAKAVVLRAKKLGADGNRIKVSAAEARLSSHDSATGKADGRERRLAGRIKSEGGSFSLLDPAGAVIARLRASEGVELNRHLNRSLEVRGPLYQVENDEPLLIVQHVADLFDVTLSYAPETCETIIEQYQGVTIGTGGDSGGLAYEITFGRSPSTLVFAEELDKTKAMLLPRGMSRWIYRDCHGARFRIGPVNAQTPVPFEGDRRLSDSAQDTPASLQLNNPLAKAVVLRAKKLGADGNRIKVSAAEARLSSHDSTAVTASGERTRLVGRVREEGGNLQLLGDSGAVIVQMRAEREVGLESHLDRVVVVRGLITQTEGSKLLMDADHVADLFDVTVSFAPSVGVAVTEQYTGVTIGIGINAAEELAYQINFGQSPSGLLSAIEYDQYNQDKFNKAYFAGGFCADRAVFNVSRFSDISLDAEAAVFATSSSYSEPQIELRFHWSQHQPGAFIVNLPKDLPERFGGRFNQTRFAMGKDAEEIYESTFTEPEPEKNRDHIVTRINKGVKQVNKQEIEGGSLLVTAEVTPFMQLGFEAATLPFRKPRRLTHGSSNRKAVLYIKDRDVPGFIQISAREDGEWGNSISVSARKSGPARFDLIVSYDGARFESARQVVMGGEQYLPALTEESLRPGPIGVLQAKAAGVKVEVTRDHAQSER